MPSSIFKYVCTQLHWSQHVGLSPTFVGRPLPLHPVGPLPEFVPRPNPPSNGAERHTIYYEPLPPMIPDIRESPYLGVLPPTKKYTLVLDLDETLVHYFEDQQGHGAYDARPGTRDFLLTMNQEGWEVVVLLQLGLAKGIPRHINAGLRRLGHVRGGSSQETERLERAISSRVEVVEVFTGGGGLHGIGKWLFLLHMISPRPLPSLPSPLPPLPPHLLLHEKLIYTG